MATAKKMAEALAARLKQSGLTQVELGKATKLSQTTISKVIRIAPNMQLGVYGAITDYLDRLDKKREKEGNADAKNTNNKA